MKISKYLFLSDATKSQTAIRKGIKNEPESIEIQENIIRTAELFDKVKEIFPSAVVSSFYRNSKLNKAIGGAKNSQHMKGEAIDIDNDNTNISNRDIFFFIKDNLDFDQLIAEKPNNGNLSWVHVSYSFFKKNRKEVLVFKNNRYSTYKSEADLL
jgi:hypothetical protein